MNIQRYLTIVFTVFLVLLSGSALAQNGKILDISLAGIDNSLLKNVRANLSLIVHQHDERLTEAIVTRFFEQAEGEIRKAVEPFGYYSPVIQKKIFSDESGWKVELEIIPGERVKISAINIGVTGPGKSDAELVETVSRYSFPLQVGDVLSHQLYEQGKKNLSSLIIASGYRDVSFRRNVVRVNKQQLSAQIYLTIDTGPQYLFGKTIFDADFISNSLLQRMLPYREGDPFSPKKIVQMRQALLNSDYFSKVDVKTGDIPAGTLNVPVDVSLSPKNPNKYGLGIGYGTDTGARASLTWTNRLLNQYGHQLNMHVQPSERKSNFGVAYTIPIYDPRKDRLSLLGKWENEQFESTETEAKYATVSYDHIGKKGEYSTYVKFLDEDYEVGLDKGHATFLYPGIKTTWRLADDRLKSKQGLRVALDVAGASNDFLSDATFLQTTLSSKAIYSFFLSWRIIGRFQFGWTEVTNVLDLSPSLRFYAGGDQSVRGYAYKSIGPEDSAGNVIGASHLLTYSLELEKNVLGNWSVAVFYDSGDAMNSLSDLAMHNGAGTGIRWNAPFGQVRLDFAKAISEGDTSWRIHFNVGADL